MLIESKALKRESKGRRRRGRRRGGGEGRDLLSLLWFKCLKRGEFKPICQLKVS